MDSTSGATPLRSKETDRTAQDGIWGADRRLVTRAVEGMGGEFAR